MNRPTSPLRPIIAVVLTVLLACVGAASAQTSKPSYPPNADGLKQFFEEMRDAVQKRDGEKVVAMSQMIILPDAQGWFKKTFGDKAGSKLATAYETDMKSFAGKWALVFSAFCMDKKVNIITNGIETPENPDAKMYQVFALEAMKNPVPLYSVTLENLETHETVGLWSFVNVDGQFRLVGKMMTIREATGKK
jgi:hypothetical protein